MYIKFRGKFVASNLSLGETHDIFFPLDAKKEDNGSISFYIKNINGKYITVNSDNFLVLNPINKIRFYYYKNKLFTSVNKLLYEVSANRRKRKRKNDDNESNKNKDMNDITNKNDNMNDITNKYDNNESNKNEYINIITNKNKDVNECNDEIDEDIYDDLKLSPYIFGNINYIELIWNNEWDSNIIGFGDNSVVFRIYNMELKKHVACKIFLTEEQTIEEEMELLQIFTDEIAKNYIFLPLKTYPINIGKINKSMIYDLGFNSSYLRRHNLNLISNGMYYTFFEQYKNILEGIIYINSKGYINCDVHTKNVIIDQKTQKLKIIDLYLSEMNGKYNIDEYFYNGIPWIILSIKNKNINCEKYEKYLDITIKLFRNIFPDDIYEKLYYEVTENIFITLKDNKDKIDLYKRLNIWSFCIYIVCVESYICKITKNIYHYMKDFIYLCCIQQERHVTPKEILASYNAFLDNIKET